MKAKSVLLTDPDAYQHTYFPYVRHSLFVSACAGTCHKDAVGSS
jgi:hypothetical protein